VKGSGYGSVNPEREAIHPVGMLMLWLSRSILTYLDNDNTEAEC